MIYKRRLLGFIFLYLACNQPADAQSSLVDSAWVLLNKGNFSEVTLFTDQVLSTISSSLPDSVVADLLNAKGLALRRLGHLQDAIAAHGTALRLREKNLGKSSSAVAKSWHNLGNCWFDLADFIQAQHAFSRALLIAKKHGDFEFLSRIYNSLGALHQEKEQLKQATTYFYASLGALQKIYPEGDPHFLNPLFNLARLQLSTRNFSKGLRYIQQLEALHSAPGASLLAMRLYGVYYRQTGYLDKAARFLRKALREWEGQAAPDFYEKIHCSIELGAVLQQLGEQDEAIGVLQRALAVLAKYPDWTDLRLTVLNNLAVLMQQSGKLVQAIEHYSGAAALLQATQIKEQRNIYLNLASLYFKQEMYDVAKAYLQSLEPGIPAAATDEQALFWLLNGLVAEKSVNPAQALFHYNRAYTILKPQSRTFPNLFAALVSAYAQGLGSQQQFRPAKRLLTEGLSALGQGVKLKNNRYPNETLQVLAVQAKLVLDEANLYPSTANWTRTYYLHQRAIQFLKSYQQGLEGQSSLLVTNWNYRTLFEGMIETCFYRGAQQEKYYRQAWIYAEMSKAFLLRRLVQENKAQLYANVSPHFLKEEQRLTQRITELRIREMSTSNPTQRAQLASLLAEAEEKKRRLIRKLEQINPDYYRLKYADVQITPMKVIKALKKNQSVVSYFWGKNYIYIFAIDASGLAIKRTKAGNAFEQQVNDWYFSLKKPATDSGALVNMGKLGLQLYRQLLQPVQPKLHARITIIPDAQLNYLPFDAMLFQRFDARLHLRKYPFLLKKYTISYASSAALWLQPPPKKTIRTRLLAIAPSFDAEQQGLSHLPNTLIEVNTLAKELAIHQDLLRSDEATETAFNKLAPQASIIHLATHGVVDDQQPDLSCLAFADYHPDSSSTGRLTVAEVYGLKLKAQLVFLSACETAIGELHAGEGMLNLSRAFYYAGAESMVSSLWSIPDNQTMQITALFYRFLGKGTAKDQSLQKAKLTYLEQSRTIRSHPAFWAAFTLSGNVDPLEFNSAWQWLWFALLICLVLGVGCWIGLKSKLFQSLLMKR